MRSTSHRPRPVGAPIAVLDRPALWKEASWSHCSSSIAHLTSLPVVSLLRSALPLSPLRCCSLPQDTAGQERFNSLNSMYFKGAQMALLVFDITRSDSFEALMVRLMRVSNSTINSILRPVCRSRTLV